MQSQHRSRRSPLPLHLEVLEDRCLLSYTLTDLGSLGGGSGAAYGINDTEQVVGYATTADARGHATLWDGGVPFDLGTLGGRNSVANAINSQGQVVGFSDNGTSPVRAFFWQHGVMTDLTPGRSYSSAHAINDAGQVVGFAQPLTGSHGGGFLWQDGVLTELGDLPGGRGSDAEGINNAGQVVGAAGIPVGSGLIVHAFLWQDGVMNDLGTFSDERDSEATAINNAGQIVGTSGVLGDEDSTRAAIWQDGTWTVIGPLNSYALAINDAGQVVGTMSSSGGSTRNRAFIYSDGELTDLNDLIPSGSGLTLAEARAINNVGQIVGTAYAGITPHAFLLTPDAGPSPRRIDPGVFPLLSPAGQSARQGEITKQPLANTQREEVPAATTTALPADALGRQATDAVFASSHRAHTPARSADWDAQALAATALWLL
jgi:probable HAF family extracellular repeat protein